jgi:hypothetical protein
MYKDELRKEVEKATINILEISFIIYKNTKVGSVNIFSRSREVCQKYIDNYTDSPQKIN